MTPATIARARRTDPLTSHEAAASVRDLTEKQWAVLLVLRDLGSATDAELVEEYDTYVGASLLDDSLRRVYVPAQSASGLRTRRSELAAAGLVKAIREGRSPSGRRALIWAAV